MRRSLFSLLGLITLWSLFYAGVKYFFWGTSTGTPYELSLESITGYILIGSMIAYTIGGPLYARYSEQMMLRVAVGVGCLSFGIAVGLPLALSIGCIGIGLAYSLYVIGKNTLIGREISTSTLGSSGVGAYTTVTFIVALIFGTIVGARIGEISSGMMIGVIYFVALLAILSGIIRLTDASQEKKEFTLSWTFIKKLLVRYGLFMVALGCFWQISVEASQIAINYSKEVFSKPNSTASLLLIFSSIGAILGNILSVRFAHMRSCAFVVFAVVFLVVIFGFSTILDLAQALDAYWIVQALAGVVGFLFGGVVNLSESHFYDLLGSDPDRDYTSALYGFVLSLVGVVMMFVADRLIHSGSYMMVSIWLGGFAICGLYGGWRGIQIQKTHQN